MIQRYEPNSNGWFSEWLKNTLGRNKEEKVSQEEDPQNNEDESDSSSGSDGGIKIPIPEWPTRLPQ